MWDEGLVYMENDNACKIVGIGSVTLKFKNHATLIVFYDKLTEGDLWHRRLSHISGKRLKML